MRVLPYWIFAVDTMSHAAQKSLATLGKGGKDTKAARTALVREQKSPRKRLRNSGWPAGRKSEIALTLKRYDGAIKSLKWRGRPGNERNGRRRSAQRGVCPLSVFRL